MHINNREWSDWPEVRIVRSLWLTNQGGLTPGSNGTGYGRVMETLLIRELQMMAREMVEADLRFARGYIVENYGDVVDDGLSEIDPDPINIDGPRIDVVCYQGNVGWTSHGGVPHAVVPASLARGVIEAKRWPTPKRITEGTGSQDPMNKQLRVRRDHLDQLDLDIPVILVGAYFSGDWDEIQRRTCADYVALCCGPNPTSEDRTEDLARRNELKTVLEILQGETPPTQSHAKGEELRGIARDMFDSEDSSS